MVVLVALEVGVHRLVLVVLIGGGVGYLEVLCVVVHRSLLLRLLFIVACCC